MALILSDRTKETSITSGAGSVVLSGPFVGFQSFSTGVGNGNTTYYTIENGSNWEVGLGTYSSSGNTLSRDTVLQSSNGDAKIVLAGVSIVFCTYPADKSIFLNPSNLLDIRPRTSGIISTDATFTNLYGLTVYNSGEIILTNTNVNKTPITFSMSNSGSFFQAYKNDFYQRTVALYTNGSLSPEWRLGLKTSPASPAAAPTFGYIYGEDGKIGLVANSTNQITISNSSNFNVKHNNVNILNASSLTGVHIDSQANSYPALVVNGGLSQSTNIQEWNTYGGTILAKVDKDGNISTTVNVSGVSGIFNTVDTSIVKFGDGSIQTTAASTALRSYKTITSNATLLITDDLVFIDSTSNSVTASLPAASGNGGKEFSFKRIHQNNIVTIQASGSEQIDGLSTFTINHKYQSIGIVSNNINWYIV